MISCFADDGKCGALRQALDRSSIFAGRCNQSAKVCCCFVADAAKAAGLIQFEVAGVGALSS
jgi:hypothetical protein